MVFESIGIFKSTVIGERIKTMISALKVLCIIVLCLNVQVVPGFAVLCRNDS